AGDSPWGGLPANRQPGISFLRLRDGDGPGLQRRGRCLDTDAHQPVLLLVLATAAGVSARASAGLGAARLVHGDHDFVVHLCGGERLPVQTRTLEAQETVTEGIPAAGGIATENAKNTEIRCQAGIPRSAA